MLVFPHIGMRSTVACLLLVLALSSAACPGGWSHWDVGNKCYRLTSGLVNAFGCATACMSLGISTTDAFQPSTLACISSSAESDFVSTLTRGLAADKSAYSAYVWIGHHQSPGSAEPGGGWDTCASGERANFTNWREGQPDDANDDGTAGINAEGSFRWPMTAQCAVIGQDCYTCTYDKWYDHPCYLAYPCLCELGAPASAEYLSSVGADIEEGLQQLRKGVAILYGAIVPALWLLPAFLRACFRLASRLHRYKKKIESKNCQEDRVQEAKNGGEGGGGEGGSEGGGGEGGGEGGSEGGGGGASSSTPEAEKKLAGRDEDEMGSAVLGGSSTLEAEKKRAEAAAAETAEAEAKRKHMEKKLTDAEEKGKRLRWRVSSTLAQLGWMLLVLGLAQTANMVYIIDLTPVAGASLCYLAAVPWGFAFQGLALRPTDEGAIRIACAAGFLIFFFIGLLLAWLSVQDSAFASDVRSIVIAGQALAAVFALSCSLIISTTLNMRFVCRNTEQFKAAAIKLQAIERGKTAPHEISKARQAYEKALTEAPGVAEKKLTLGQEIPDVDYRNQLNHEKKQLRRLEEEKKGNGEKGGRAGMGGERSANIDELITKLKRRQEAEKKRAEWDKAKMRDEAAKKHLEFLKKLKEMKSEERQEQAIVLCKEYLKTQHTDNAAALKELAEHIEVSQCEPGQLKAIQNTRSRSVERSRSAATLALRLFGIDVIEAIQDILAFCGSSGGGARGESAVAIQSHAFGYESWNALRIRAMTMPPFTLWFAFRLAFIGDVVYYHNKKTNGILWKKPDDVKAAEAEAKQFKTVQEQRAVGAAAAEKAAVEKAAAEKVAAAQAAAMVDFEKKMKNRVDEFMKADSDGSTELDFDEFTKMHKQRCAKDRLPDPTENELKDLFSRLDLDDSGTLDLAEYVQYALREEQAAASAENEAAEPAAADQLPEAATQHPWMEFKLEYTMAPRRQLRRMWLVLRLFFSGGALFCFAIFISTVLYVPIDPSGPTPFALWILVGANLLATALVFTRANRGRVVAWLGALGKTGEAENKAAALAALVGSLSAAEAFKLGAERFRKLPLAKLKLEEIAGRKSGAVAGDWKTSPGWPTRELYNKTTLAKIGEVDAFISHSWSDDGDAKFKCLQEWKTKDLKNHKDKKAVTIWLDKACLDQRDIQASLAGLPVFISGCKQLLVLAGKTYASRLWCVIELFVFVQLGRNVKEDMIVKLLSDTPDLQEGLHTFDAGKSETFDPNDRQRLLAVIEASFGTFGPFNKIIQATAPTAKLEASDSIVVGGGPVTLTSTFKNESDPPWIESDRDGLSRVATIFGSGQETTVWPTVTTKYTLKVVSPNGITATSSALVTVDPTLEPTSPARLRRSLSRSFKVLKRSMSFGSIESPVKVHP